MEVKLSLRQSPPELRLPLFQSKSNFPSCSERFPPKRFRATVKKWRLRLQEMSTCQYSAKHYVVHVVQGGDTLTSISKQYGVSVYAIAAANKNIADIDLVYQGQQINIPSVADGLQVGERSWSANFKLPKRFMPLNVSNEVLSPKNFGLLYSRFVPHVSPWYSQARNIGYFLVLVPLIAFCIRCIAGAIQGRATKEFRECNVTDYSGVKHHSSRGGRWKSALGDAWEPDLMDGESNLGSTELIEIHSEDTVQISHEEESRAYTKLEQDYQEFLSKCGMSKFGYWRGGTSR